MTEYIPLRADGSKAPAVSGWQKPEYHCTKKEALAQSDWIGMRSDGLVIVDCDTYDAAKAWLTSTGEVDGMPRGTKTPRGYHFYYEAVEGGPTGPAVGVLDKVDIRAGLGSYVVAAESPGYTEIQGAVRPFDPAWLAQAVPAPGQGTSSPDQDAGWEFIPDGRRNDMLASMAGAIWRQGPSLEKFGQLVLALNKALCQPPLDRNEVSIIVKSISRYEQQPDEAYVIDEDLVDDPDEPVWLDARDFGPPPPKTWLWYPYIPDANMTLCSGREGIGKGMFCVYLAAAVAMGVHPETGETCEPKAVAWLTAEDDAHDDIWPRLRAAGWDPKVHEAIKFLNRKVVLKLPEDSRPFERAVGDVDNCGLVIMDPGRSYFGRKDGGQISYNDEADVRPALVELQGIAKALRLPFVFVAHWRKGDGHTRDMTSGSGAWRQVVRHGLDFAENDSGQQRAFWVGKTNIDQKGYVRGYSTVGVPEFETARFVLGDPLPYPSLDLWLQAVKNEEYVVDEMERLLPHIEHTEPGKLIANRQTLCKLTGISDAKMRLLLDELKDTGRVEHRPGLGNIWLR